MSIHLRKKRQPVIWSVPQLPSDCSWVLAVPRGGVLVLSQNLLLYYAQVSHVWNAGSCWLSSAGCVLMRWVLNYHPGEGVSRADFRVGVPVLKLAWPTPKILDLPGV